MEVKEYRVIKKKYGHPKLKTTHTYKSNLEKISNCYDIADLLDEIFDLSYCNEEYMYVVSMDTGGHIKGIFELGHGDYEKVPGFNRELYIFLLLSGAEAFYIAHNHPNGVLEPSKGDMECTNLMIMCANVLHIEFLDHLILTEDDCIGIKNECLSNIKIDLNNLNL